jgi:hypothetical protein
MSSDESSIENGHRVYVVLAKRWRAPAVTLWLRDMDGVHLALRATDTGRIMRGNWPHERRDLYSRLSDRGPVEGLPINFYSGDWVSSLPHENVEDVKIDRARYDFAHTDRIAQ